MLGSNKTPERKHISKIILCEKDLKNCQITALNSIFRFAETSESELERFILEYALGCIGIICISSPLTFLYTQLDPGSISRAATLDRI